MGILSAAQAVLSVIIFQQVVTLCIHKKSPRNAGSLEEQLIDSYDTIIA
jgi:hypothetical protein